MVPGPRERRPKSSGSPIAYQVDRVEHLSPDKLFLGFWDFFLCLKMDQLDLGTCPGTQQGTWTHGRYTGSKFYFFRVDRTWVHLPGSQGRGPGYGRENFRGFFVLFSQHGPPTLGNSTRFTGKGACLRGREFSGIFFILSKWTTCTWELYQVHREEVLETDEKIFGETFSFSQGRLGGPVPCLRTTRSTGEDRPRPGTRPWDPSGSWDSGRRARG